MTKATPFRGVAVAAVACAVGTPGVQWAGCRGCGLRHMLPRHPTGGMPPPPPCHPATRQSCLAAFGLSLGLAAPPLASVSRCSPLPPSSLPVFADRDFNLGEGGIRDIRGRVVSRPRHPDNIRGHALGHCWSRFTGPPAALAITCVGCKPMIFWAFFA